MFVAILAHGIVRADRAMLVDIPELARRSDLVVEGLIVDVRSIPFRSEKTNSEFGPTTDYIAIDDNEYQQLIASDSNAAANLLWLHEAQIEPIAAVSVTKFEIKPGQLTIQYVTYPEARADVYQGPLPIKGKVFSFFLRSGHLFPFSPVIQEQLQKAPSMKYRVDLFNEIGPPGIVKTLVQGKDGRLATSKKTLKDMLRFFQYLHKTGQPWNPPAILPNLKEASSLNRSEKQHDANIGETTSQQCGRNSSKWPYYLLGIALVIGFRSTK